MSYLLYTPGDTQYEVVHALAAEFASADAVTAFAGGGQTNATQLAATKNNVSVCATAADSVKLPAGAIGLHVFIRNSGVASLQVYGNGTDTINGVATATGVAQAAAKGAIYFCTTAQPAAKWYQILGA